MITSLLCLAVLAQQSDIADVRVQDRFAGGDKAKRYFFIDAAKPDDAKQKSLLLILPGGAGNADFQPFCARIAKFGLPGNFVAAELVAPIWTSSQAENLVWPTKLNPWNGMKFSTEEFMSAVIDDVRKSGTPFGKVYALGWSSGGPPVYAAALQKDSPYVGAFIAMSIGPSSVPDKITNKRFFILHSPQDRLIDIGIAEGARDALRRAGAPTKMITYPGGHGWSGNVYGNISEGINFLEKGWKG